MTGLPIKISLLKKSIKKGENSYFDILLFH
jgi:hypothetical protein